MSKLIWVSLESSCTRPSVNRIAHVILSFILHTKINQNDKALRGCGTIIPLAVKKLRLFFSIGLDLFKGSYSNAIM